MVFERKHMMNTSKNMPIGAVSDIVQNYNNTNASGYINKIRYAQRLQAARQCGTVCHHNDPPPLD